MGIARRVTNIVAVTAGLAIVLSATVEICAAQSVIEYNVPTVGSFPYGMAAGPDGNIWFTEDNGNKIGKITLGGTITEFLIPTSGSLPLRITAGPDGNLWFTENATNKIGKITTSGIITEYLVPTSGSGPSGIVAGPDGNLWFTEILGNKIGKATSGGIIVEYPIPTSASGPRGIAAGSDGNLWFTELTANKIGKITTSGAVTEYIVPTSGGAPFRIGAGSDGNLWFTEYNGNEIGKITPAGTITEYPIPTSGSEPDGLVAAPDGNIWFTEVAGNKIGKITTAGTITEYLVPTAGSDPGGIAAGADGNIWFTEGQGNKIGVLYTSGQVFPHLSMGPLGSDVWTTAIILNNTTNNPASFSTNFIQDNGQPMPLGSNGIFNETQQASFLPAQNGQGASGMIAAKSTLTMVLSSATFVEGWATLSGTGITGQVVFHRHTSAGADYEATVPLSVGGTEYLVPFDATSYFNGNAQVATLPYITGMALANLDPSNTAIINCLILDPNGLSLGSASPISLPPLGHTALQLNAATGFGNVAGKIGSLDCSSNGTSFAVLGLRFLGGNDLTSFAAIRLF